MRPLFTLFLLAFNVLGATEIRDTSYTSINGGLFSGRITITGPDMTTADGRTVQRTVQSFTITNGVIAFDLEPNDTAMPAGTSYHVVYRSTSGLAWSERWVVPTSATPLKISQVRVLTTPTPSLSIQPSQILGGGAADGQALLWNATVNRWQPGAAGQVTSVFGRTGGVTAQAGDYAVADVAGLPDALAGKAPASHQHDLTHITSVGAQNASTLVYNSSTELFEAKLRFGPYVYADDHCATAGTFDETCINNAVAALPSGGGVVKLAAAEYVVSNQVLVNAKSVYIMAERKGSRIKAANSYSGHVVKFMECTGCGIVGVSVDGNKANRSATASGDYSVYLYNTLHGLVEECDFVGSVSGSVLVGGATAAQSNCIVVTRNRFDTPARINSTRVETAALVFIEDNDFDYRDPLIVVPTADFDPDAYGRNALVRLNACETCVVRGNRFTGNYQSDPGEWYADLRHVLGNNSTSLIVTNNVFWGAVWNDSIAYSAIELRGAATNPYLYAVGNGFKPTIMWMGQAIQTSGVTLSGSFIHSNYGVQQINQLNSQLQTGGNFVACDSSGTPHTLATVGSTETPAMVCAGTAPFAIGGYEFPDATTTTLYFNLPPPMAAVHSTGFTVNLPFWSATAPSSSRYVKFEVAYYCSQSGNVVVTPTFTVLGTGTGLLNPGTAGKWQYGAVWISSLPPACQQYMIWRVRRLGSDAEDTYTGSIVIPGMTVVWPTTVYY